MSVHDMYPADQWRHHHRHNHGSRSHPHQHQSYSQPRPQYNRRRRHCRRRQSTPIFMNRPRLGMGGPRLGMMGLMNIFSSSSINPNDHSSPQHNNSNNSQYNQPNQPKQPIIIDTIKKGEMEIEYNVLFKYYRRKYFLLKSDNKLYYYSNSNSIYSKPDGIIDLLKVITLKKCENNILELELNNKLDNGVDIVKLLTPDTTKWRLKCNEKEARNDWFDCIRCFVSQNKNVVYIERDKCKDKNESKCDEDEWEIIDNNGLDLDMVQPENNVNGNEFIAPPAYAPGYDVNGNLRGNNEGNYNHNVDEYGDEGKLTLQ